jgi:cell division ATPase FtsA
MSRGQNRILEESEVCEIIYPNLEEAVKLVEEFVEKTSESWGQL